MNKIQLVLKVSQEARISRAQAVKAVKSLVMSIRDTLRGGGKISLSGLGTFKVKARKARAGRNPQTGESISLPAGRKISFRPSLSLRKLIKASSGSPA